MNKTKLRIIVFLLILMSLLLITNKALAVSFTGEKVEIGDTILVPYGKTLTVTKASNETITLEKEYVGEDFVGEQSGEIPAELNGDKLKIKGVGRFCIKSVIGSETNRINFFAWNGFLKLGAASIFTDEETEKLVNENSQVYSKTYFALERLTDYNKAVKIKDAFFAESGHTTGIGNESDETLLIDCYLTCYYDEATDKSSSSHWEYSFKVDEGGTGGDEGGDTGGGDTGGGDTGGGDTGSGDTGGGDTGSGDHSGRPHSSGDTAGDAGDVTGAAVDDAEEQSLLDRIISAISSLFIGIFDAGIDFVNNSRVQAAIDAAMKAYNDARTNSYGVWNSQPVIKNAYPNFDDYFERLHDKNWYDDEYFTDQEAKRLWIWLEREGRSNVSEEFPADWNIYVKSKFNLPTAADVKDWKTADWDKWFSPSSNGYPSSTDGYKT